MSNLFIQRILSILKKYERKILSAVLIIISIFLIAMVVIDLIPLLKNVIGNIKDESAITSDIQEYGAQGVLLLAALQALQVITIIFPSAPIQILAGLTYGIFFGLLICLAGYMIGNTIVFVLIRRFGDIFLPFNTVNKKIRKKSRWDLLFSIKSENVEFMAFLLFLIPGIPNGILPYIFAKSRITLPRYLLAILLAGTPAILICTLVGERIADGDIYTAAIVFGIFVIIALLVLVLRSRIISFIKKKN